MPTTALVVLAAAIAAAVTGASTVAVAAVVFGSRIYGQDDPRDVGLRRSVGQHRQAHGDVRARAVQDFRRDHRQRGGQQAARLHHVQTEGGWGLSVLLAFGL